MITLIMELNREQGGDRESQVQPPYEVWEQFFGVSRRASRLPAYRLISTAAGAVPEQRKVVKHHHNLTIEITGARGPRPAILRMTPDGVNAFQYSIVRKGERFFSRFDWLLREFGVASAGDRRWIILSNE